MKRFISLLIAIALCAALGASAFADVSPKDVVGDWFVQYIGEDNLVIAGKTVVVSFNRDKSVTVTVDGTAAKGQWIWEISGDDVDIRTADGDSNSLQAWLSPAEDGSLRSNGTLEVSGEEWRNMVLVRELKIPQAIPNTVMVEDEETFYGAYEFIAAYINGYEAVLDEYDTATMADARLVIDFAECTLYDGDDSETLLTDFVDGKILIMGDDITYQIAMLENNNILFSLPDDMTYAIEFTHADGSDTIAFAPAGEETAE